MKYEMFPREVDCYRNSLFTTLSHTHYRIAREIHSLYFMKYVHVFVVRLSFWVISWVSGEFVRHTEPHYSGIIIVHVLRPLYYWTRGSAVLLFTFKVSEIIILIGDEDSSAPILC